MRLLLLVLVATLALVSALPISHVGPSYQPFRKLPPFPPARPARKRPQAWSAPYGFGWTWPPRAPSRAPAFVKIMRSGARVPVMEVEGREGEEGSGTGRGEVGGIDAERGGVVGVVLDVTIVEE